MAQNIVLFRDIAFILAIAINIINLACFSYDSDGNSTNSLENTIKILGIMVISMVMIIVAYFLAKTAPLLIQKA